jgi:hypothetical protein
MADSATPFGAVTASASAAAFLNSQLNALSPQALYGLNPDTTTGLTWGYYGGDMLLSGVPTAIAAGTRQLVASRTQHLEVGPVQIAPAGTITGITIANPCVVTTSGSHGLQVGDVVWLVSIVGTVQLNESWNRITAVTSTTITLEASSVGLTAYSSNGTVHRMSDAGTNWAVGIGRGLGADFVAPIPLYQVVAGASSITSYTDVRSAARNDLGLVTVAVGGSANVIATAAQSRGGRNGSMINLTGTLTGNIAFVLPPLAGTYVIRNSTTGAFTLTVRTPAGTGVVVAAGDIRHLVCDGIDIFAVT